MNNDLKLPNVIKSEAKVEEVIDFDNFQTIIKLIGIIRAPKVTQNNLIPTYGWSSYLSPGLLKAKVPLYPVRYPDQPINI